MIDISIITVVMNHLPFIREMLRSLYGEGMPKATFETIIVDNCSTDGSFEFVRDHYPEIRLIRNEHPFGFARNNNIGAAQASGKYILILNPDIIGLDSCRCLLQLRHSGRIVKCPRRLVSMYVSVFHSIEKYCS